MASVPCLQGGVGGDGNSPVFCFIKSLLCNKFFNLFVVVIIRKF